MRDRASLGALITAAFVLTALAWSAPALAHHGWGGYLDDASDLSGTVESPVSLAGPHATMKIKTADGAVWDVVLAPPAPTERAGLKESSIPVGAMVTVHGNRHRDPKRLEIKVSRVTWNGRTFDVYPDRR